MKPIISDMSKWFTCFFMASILMLISNGASTSKMPLPTDKELDAILESLLKKQSEEEKNTQEQSEDNTKQERSSKGPALKRSRASQTTQKGTPNTGKKNRSAKEAEEDEELERVFPDTTYLFQLEQRKYFRNSCFPIEDLRKDLQPTAKKLIMNLLSSEALYTIVTDQKPISILNDWYFDQLFSGTNKDDLELIFECMHFGPEIKIYLNKERKKECCHKKKCDHSPNYQFFVINEHALREKIKSNKQVFEPLSISSKVSIDELVYRINNTTQKNRFLGYLLGHPEHSIEFLSDPSRDETETAPSANQTKLSPRKKITIRTPSSYLFEPRRESYVGEFSWSTHADHELTTEEKEKMNSLQKVLCYYMTYLQINTEKKELLERFRDWLDDGSGYCSAKEAMRKVLYKIPPLKAKSRSNLLEKWERSHINSV